MKNHQLLLILTLSNVFYSVQALASDPKTVVEVGSSPCEITAEQLAIMPFKGKPTIYPKDITVVVDDPNTTRRYDWEQYSGYTPDPIITNSLKNVLENTHNSDPTENTSNLVSLIDVDDNGFCDLFISSPYESASLYLADSEGYLINGAINSRIPYGNFISITPIYLNNRKLPYIYFDVSNSAGGQSGLWSWEPSTKQPISDTNVNFDSNQDLITIYDYYYEQAVNKAIETLRKGLIHEADSYLDEARQFDLNKDYKRLYYAGIIQYIEKSYSFAESYFLNALKIPKLTTEEQALIFYNLGLTQQALKKTKEALESFNKYLILTPEGQYAGQVKQIIESMNANQ